MNMHLLRPGRDLLPFSFSLVYVGAFKSAIHFDPMAGAYIAKDGLGRSQVYMAMGCALTINILKSSKCIMLY